MNLPDIKKLFERMRRLAPNDNEVVLSLEWLVKEVERLQGLSDEYDTALVESNNGWSKTRKQRDTYREALEGLMAGVDACKIRYEGEGIALQEKYNIARQALKSGEI